MSERYSARAVASVTNMRNVWIMAIWTVAFCQGYRIKFNAKTSRGHNTSEWVNPCAHPLVDTQVCPYNNACNLF